LFVENFAEPVSAIEPTMTLIAEALQNNLKVAIAHVPALESLGSKASVEIETFALENGIDMAWHLERELDAETPIRTTGMMATAGSVSVKFDRLPKIESQEHALLVENPDTVDPRFLAVLSRNFMAMFGNAPKVLSLSDESRSAIRDLGWLNSIATGNAQPGGNRRNTKSEL
jgi:hypothetical protein